MSSLLVFFQRILMRMNSLKFDSVLRELKLVVIKRTIIASGVQVCSLLVHNYQSLPLFLVWVVVWITELAKGNMLVCDLSDHLETIIQIVIANRRTR